MASRMPSATPVPFTGDEALQRRTGAREVAVLIGPSAIPQCAILRTYQDAGRQVGRRREDDARNHSLSRILSSRPPCLTGSGGSPRGVWGPKPQRAEPASMTDCCMQRPYARRVCMGLTVAGGVQYQPCGKYRYQRRSSLHVHKPIVEPQCEYVLGEIRRLSESANEMEERVALVTDLQAATWQGRPTASVRLATPRPRLRGNPAWHRGGVCHPAGRRGWCFCTRLCS